MLHRKEGGVLVRNIGIAKSGIATLSLAGHTNLKVDLRVLFYGSLPEETFVSVDEDSLHILLSFALAHGTVNSILDTMQILLGEWQCPSAT